MSERAHCWTDGPRTEDDCGTTCMEWEGHEGPHDFVRDDEILVTFVPDEEAK